MALASLDSNVLLRLVLRDDPALHRRARALMLEPGAIFEVSDHVIVEFVFALDRYYGLSRHEIAQTVTTVVGLENVRCHADVLTAAVEFWTSRPKLSFEDCLVAERAASRDAVPLWTFDRKLALQHPSAREVPPAVARRGGGS